MLSREYWECNIGLIRIYDAFDRADLLLIVAVSNDAIANLDIQRLNFQLLLNFIK